MTEEEINEVRIRVLDDVLDALNLAAGDIKHLFESGQPGIGTKTAGQIAARLSRIRHGYVQRMESDGLKSAEDNTDQPAA